MNSLRKEDAHYEKIIKNVFSTFEKIKNENEKSEQNDEFTDVSFVLQSISDVKNELSKFETELEKISRNSNEEFDVVMDVISYEITKYLK